MPVAKKALRKKKVTAKKLATVPRSAFRPYTALDFSKIQRTANALADHIESHFEELAHTLLEYESYEVVLDEYARTLDLLRNLDENKAYFRLRVGGVTAFLPRNQPLYAFACFVIVPSLMASEVHFRIPHSMRHFFPKLMATLEVAKRFPNIFVSHTSRTDFVRERSALRVNPKTHESLPVTDAVIFTGTPAAAEQLRLVFDRRTLFITNGAGHNPVVVSEDADLISAVEATLMLQLYNQGQDCAAPNAILVHQSKYQDFLRMLRDEIRAVRVGDYRDRRCRVGPISDPKDLVRIKAFLLDHREWLDPTTPGVMRAYDAILEPTIITKPLADGGNYNEIFAPIIFLQKYDSDDALARYFEHPRYAQNAMYVTLYGSSDYIKSLIGRIIDTKVLHAQESFLHNNHLHAPGAERGTQPYGGNGYGASNIAINGTIVSKPTLPQREIYEYVAKPLLRDKARNARLKLLKGATDIHYKDVLKLMRLKTQEPVKQEAALSQQAAYIDMHGVAVKGKRYVPLGDSRIFHLLSEPNAEYIAGLQPKEVEDVRTLRTLILNRDTYDPVDFVTALYAIPVPPKTRAEKKPLQLRFFKNVYNLLMGQDSGPRLSQFLLEVDPGAAAALLDI